MLTIKGAPEKTKYEDITNQVVMNGLFEFWMNMSNILMMIGTILTTQRIKQLEILLLMNIQKLLISFQNLK